MPTVHEFDGYRVFIPTNDHRPEHVHIEKAENEVIFLLNCPGGPVTLRENFGFKSKNLNDIERELNAIVPALCREWESIHGDP